jgi:hypothetical protein
MNDSFIHSFLPKLFNWKEFEIFVTDLYKDSEEVETA